MIVRWPGQVEAGSINPWIGHVIDFLPTLMELGEAPFLAEREGIPTIPPEGTSLVPAFRGETESRLRFLHWGLYGNRAVRHGKWKLVWGTSREEWELYRLDTDRTETVDVIQQHPNQFRRMRDSWLRWARRTGYPLESDRL